MSIRRAQSAVWRRTLTGVVVSGAGSSELKLLAPPGDAVWEAIAEPVTRAELIRGLAERFGEDPDVIEGDVDAMVGDLMAAGLAEECPPDGSDS